MRPHQYNKKKRCYYCGTPGPNDREHAPPEMMFKHVKFCDRITVPSCDIHNSRKSGRDAAIVACLLKGIEQEAAHGLRRSQIPATVLESLQVLCRIHEESKRTSTLGRRIIDAPDSLDFGLPYLQPDVDILQWAVCLTAALVWSATGDYDPESDWDRAWKWSPYYYPASPGSQVSLAEAIELAQNQAHTLELVDADNEWHQGWSAHPRPYPAEIYNFAISFGRFVLMRHTFYGGFRIFVGFSTSQNTVDVLKRAVGLGTV